MNRILNEMDSPEREFGSGYISGMLSILLAAGGLATVLCLMYPQWLTVADVRGYYDMGRRSVRVASGSHRRLCPWCRQRDASSK